MPQPNALVLRAAGTNCEQETRLALELAGARAELLHLARLLERPERLEEARILVLPGGFSFGDDIAAGRVFGLELRLALAERLRSFVEQGGLVLGICNGFQVLVDSGLLEPGGPTLSGAKRSLALYDNRSNHYECRWVTLETEDCVCPFVSPGERWPVPVAHGEGRFVVRDDATLERLRRQRQIAFRYVSPEGGPAPYPLNPNGSRADIAGICDPTGRVLGLMPHPERNVLPWHHPRWTRLPGRSAGEGLTLFQRMVECASHPAAALR
jgi:phosphoribosylformylglycinamidine synthase I